VEQYEKSVLYDRLLDEPAKYKFKLTRIVNTSKGPQEFHTAVVNGFESHVDKYGDFISHI
jgi:hypothetical protein